MVSPTEQLDTAIRIVTPENIAFEYRVAGPFRRLPAFLIDVAVRLILLLVVVQLVALLFGARGSTFAIGVIAFFLIDWFYGGFCETVFNGQTPGKWLLGLRVLSFEGQPINGLQATMRNILRFVDMMPLLPLGGPPIPLFTVGLLTMALTQRYQRLGDLVCGTMVVIEERSWLRGVAKLEDPRAAQLAALLPADFPISRSLARSLAVYVDRRTELPVVRRREIAQHLAAPLLKRLGLREDTSYDLLLCALYHRAFIADRATSAKDESKRAGAGAAAGIEWGATRG